MEILYIITEQKQKTQHNRQTFFDAFSISKTSFNIIFLHHTYLAFVIDEAEWVHVMWLLDNPTKKIMLYVIIQLALADTCLALLLILLSISYQYYL